MTRLPDGFQALRPAGSEAEEVAALVRAVELELEGLEETKAEDILRDWAGADLERDAILVREGARLIGAGFVEPTPRGAFFDGYVHQSATGRGIGSFLVRTLEVRGRELAAGPSLVTQVSLNDPAGQSLLESEAYRAVRRWLRMAVDLDAPPETAAVPGVEIRALRPGDEEAFHAAFERSFAGHWGHTPRPFAEWWADMDARSGGDFTFLFVAERGGELVGETSGLPERFGMGWIGTLGVVPEARGLGIGRALLLHQLGAFWARGIRRVGLGVDAGNETGATRLYESVGMDAPFGAIEYEKDVRAGTVSV